MSIIQVAVILPLMKTIVFVDTITGKQLVMTGLNGAVQGKMKGKVKGKGNDFSLFPTMKEIIS